MWWTHEVWGLARARLLQQNRRRKRERRRRRQLGQAETISMEEQELFVGQQLQSTGMCQKQIHFWQLCIMCGISALVGITCLGRDHAHSWSEQELLRSIGVQIASGRNMLGLGKFWNHHKSRLGEAWSWAYMSGWTGRASRVPWGRGFSKMLKVLVVSLSTQAFLVTWVRRSPEAVLHGLLVAAVCSGKYHCRTHALCSALSVLVCLLVAVVAGLSWPITGLLCVWSSVQPMFPPDEFAAALESARGSADQKLSRQVSNYDFVSEGSFTARTGGRSSKKRTVGELQEACKASLREEIVGMCKDQRRALPADDVDVAEPGASSCGQTATAPTQSCAATGASLEVSCEGAQRHEALGAQAAQSPPDDFAATLKSARGSADQKLSRHVSNYDFVSEGSFGSEVQENG